MGQPGAKILVIDDEAALLQSLVAYLEDSGFKVYSADNGKNGYAVYEAEQPDLILTDIHMPVQTGLELLRSLTQQNSDTPVIVISGAGELNDAIEALRLGAWDFITKPISDMKVLEHAVNKALERKNLIAENKMFEQRIAQNLKILEEDQAAGRRVQLSLLPHNKLEAQGYLFDYKIIPSLQLSGDFVEYFHVADDLYVVYIADVSGHGSSSAFITVLLKSLIGQYLAHYRVNHDETILSPVRMMKILSNEIYGAKLSKYLTIIYGVLNTTNNEFVYGVGGHYPSPVILKADLTCAYLPGSGFPIGIMDNADYTEQKIVLEENQKILFFSDGVMEVLLPGSTLEQKDVMLLDIITKTGGNISKILESCGAAAAEQTKSQPDDITVLAIAKH